jgi:L-seryl-tRNA(Ser) seleniumtransferase
MPNAERLRLLPKVDQVLQDEGLAGLLRELQRDLVVGAVQEEIEALRERLRADGTGTPADRPAAQAEVVRGARLRLEALARPTLCRVVNATGVILHTNLGRAQLSEAAIEAVVQVARGYVNLEYDLHAGERSSRMAHLEPLLAHLFGSESALAVNNNAAAILLAIDTLGQAGVIVSRGELVEIGDSFRLPDILAKAGVPIHEVGTTNRTTPEDYEAAAERPGCVLLKVHPSNFAMRGFTRQASIAELSQVAARRGATLVFDLGSGALVPLAEHGLAGEPDPRNALAEGAHVVTMSGDKLLGGPQAGIVAGSAEAILAMRRNPLMRALRIDKLTLAALQATLLSYASRSSAQQDIPTLRLILCKPEEIEARARRLSVRLGGQIEAEIEVAPCRASVGGGSFAELELPSFELRVRPSRMRATELLARLRRGTPPVVARIKDETVGLDMRCVAEEEVDALAGALSRALGSRGGEV